MDAAQGHAVVVMRVDHPVAHPSQPAPGSGQRATSAAQGHRYHPPKFDPNPKHHDEHLIFPHFARAACLLLACLLLLNLIGPP